MQSETEVATRTPGSHYDQLPYLSLPFAYTQPAHLAALATLHGLGAPSPDRARVLELGCASGGNLIPLAVRFPESRCLGLDLSERQISDGQRRQKALGLTNIELRQGDIAKVALPAGQFDYVICHGVYSWVPPAVQDAILRLASHCLSDNGMVAISYNVLPGWHLRSIMRETLLRHVGPDGTPQERVAKVRALLPLLAETPQQPGHYAQLLSYEARLLARMPSSYLLGEFLTEHNHPCSFEDFRGRAGRHDLSFLCEADLGATARSLLTPKARRSVVELSGGDADRIESYFDLLSGRPFRRSILVRSKHLRGGRHTIRAERLIPLHISSNLRPAPEASRDGVYAFTVDRGQSVTTKVPSIGAALERLAAAFPGTLAVAGLAAEGAERGTVARALLNLTMEGKAALSALPLRVGRAADLRPRVWTLARAEAAYGLPGVTSQRHVAVALSRPALAIAGKLDGTRDRIELTQGLTRDIESGALHLPDAMTGDGASGTAAAAKLVNETLRQFEECAILAPD